MLTPEIGCMSFHELERDQEVLACMAKEKKIYACPCIKETRGGYIYHVYVYICMHDL